MYSKHNNVILSRIGCNQLFHRIFRVRYFSAWEIFGLITKEEFKHDTNPSNVRVEEFSCEQIEQITKLNETQNLEFEKIKNTAVANENVNQITNAMFRIQDMKNPALKMYCFDEKEFLQGAHFVIQALVKNRENLDSWCNLLYPNLLKKNANLKKSSTPGRSNIWHFFAWQPFSQRKWQKVMIPTLERLSTFRLHPADFERLSSTEEQPQKETPGITEGYFAVIDVKAKVQYAHKAPVPKHCAENDPKVESSSFYVRFGGWISHSDPDYKIMNVSTYFDDNPFKIYSSFLHV